MFVILVVIPSKLHFFIYQKNVINKKYKLLDEVVKRAFPCCTPPVLGFCGRDLEYCKTIFHAPKNSFVECLHGELFKRSRDLIVCLPYFMVFQIVTRR